MQSYVQLAKILLTSSVAFTKCWYYKLMVVSFSPFSFQSTCSQLKL